MTKPLEHTLIARVINGGDQLTTLVAELEQEDFVHYPHEAKIIFKAWHDNVTPTTALLNAGIKISPFVESSDYTTPIKRLCEELRRHNTARTVADILLRHSKVVQPNNVEDIVASVQSQTLKTISRTTNEDVSIDSVISEFKAFQKMYAEKNARGEKLLGTSTGFNKLDEIIDGLRDGHLWIIGGYTNLGKTYAALNILTHLLKQKKRTVFYSLEMTRVDILARILGIMTENNGNAISKANTDAQNVDDALETIRASELAIFKDKNDISQIILSIHEECIRNKPSLIVIDFLQLVQCKEARTEYEATTKAILEIQKAAQRHNVPIIVLSQVSNEGARAGDQQVMGFKGSGGIAAAADLAIELVSGEESVIALREKMKKGDPVFIKWHIKKNRHGRVGTIFTKFTGKHGIFKELED